MDIIERDRDERMEKKESQKGKKQVCSEYCVGMVLSWYYVGNSKRKSSVFFNQDPLLKQEFIF